MSMTEVLKISSVTKKYSRGEAESIALDGVSFNAGKGDFIAVMGPSGSGKSTLLHVTAGLTRADDGTIHIEGQDISKLGDGKLSALRRGKIGFIFQSFNLIPGLTVEENIVLPLKAAGMKPDHEALEKLAKRLGIADKLKRMPDTLSGGEQQRAAIARALLPKPSIILADEPTGSLDTHAGQALCKLMKEISSESGAAIILVTHEPSVAAWAKKVVILKDGKIAGSLEGAEVSDAHKLALKYHDIIDA